MRDYDDSWYAMRADDPPDYGDTDDDYQDLEDAADESALGSYRERGIGDDDGCACAGRRP